MSFKKWFGLFKTEKGWSDKTYEVEADGLSHFISTDVVEESILSATEVEHAFIKDALVRIDVANGDVHHFFEHIALCLAKSFAADAVG